VGVARYKAVIIGKWACRQEEIMKNMEDVREGKGGLIIHCSPGTLRSMYDDYNKIIKSDNYNDDFKQFISNRMDELSDRHAKLIGIDIDIYISIYNLYIKVLTAAQINDLETHNISIYARSELALAMGKYLTIEYLPITRNIPVIIDNSIKEFTNQNSIVNQSDIWITSPDWDN